VLWMNSPEIEPDICPYKAPFAYSKALVNDGRDPRVKYNICLFEFVHADIRTWRGLDCEDHMCHLPGVLLSS
jgi:hypothetical protein